MLVVLTQSQQHSTQERTVGQVERPSRFLVCQPQHLGLASLRKQPTQFDHWHTECLSQADDLYWLIFAYGESCAQVLMPPHDLLHASLQRPGTQLTAEPYSMGNSVGSTPRFQLVKEPQALLGKREW